MVCTKIKGEPVYEVVKPVPTHQELVVYYLPERPEELFFARMRNTLYRQTMDSILEGLFANFHLNMQLLNTPRSSFNQTENGFRKKTPFNAKVE